MMKSQSLIGNVILENYIDLWVDDNDVLKVSQSLIGNVIHNGYYYLSVAQATSQSLIGNVIQISHRISMTKLPRLNPS